MDATQLSIISLTRAGPGQAESNGMLDVLFLGCEGATLSAELAEASASVMPVTDIPTEGKSPQVGGGGPTG